MKCRIRELRQAAGLKQSKLAELSGIAQENISRYEKGRLSIENMTLASANSIAKACGCRIEDLFEEEKTMEKEIFI
ncbi:MAG: helix-turn-helix transcriptional regulator [Oscillospiraceae bacterium]